VARDLTVNDAGDRPPSILTLGLPAKLYLFCPGILVAVAERSGALRRGMSRLDGVPALRVCTAGIGVAVALWLLGVAADGSGASSLGHALRDEVFGLGFGLLLVIALWSPAWRSLPARALAAIGVVSYGLYLWHPVTEELLRERHLVALPWAATCVVLALAGLVPAAVSWFAVERPALARAAVLTAAPAPRVARAADTPVPAAARR
jgi:peptidoglycan/LPS O-acetylase OafA/YrhL